MLIDDDSGKTPNAANKSRQTYHYFGYYTKELPLPVEFFFPTAMIKKLKGDIFVSTAIKEIVA